MWSMLSLPSSMGLERLRESEEKRSRAVTVKPRMRMSRLGIFVIESEDSEE